MLKQKIAAGIIGLAMVLPMMASADTATDAQTQIQTLLSQIKALQEQIRTIISSNPAMLGGSHDTTGTSTPQGGGNGNSPCFMPMRGLGLGTRGEDVKDLQKMLRGDEESEFRSEATGVFGPQTAKALARWQKHNGIGSSTLGTVGPRTQEFFKKRCGEGKDDHGMKGGMMMNMPAHIMGSITTANGNDITVTNADGKMVVVHVTGSTTIKSWNGTSTQPTAGTLTNLVVGKKITADGPKNSDGTINAVHVMVGDTLPMMNIMGHEDNNEHGGRGGHSNDNYTHGSMGDMMSGHGDR